MLAREVCCCFNALLFVLAILATPLSAAIVQNGDVVPDVNTWTSGTVGFVGHTSEGSVTVDGGNTLASGNGYLGYEPGSTGMVTVTGTGSQWINSNWLGVGEFGNGTLNITEGGQVDSPKGFLGYRPGSAGTVTVTGTGSEWNNSHETFVGFGGNGNLTIEAGGQVNSRRSYLGDFFDSTGVATVTGTGSQWTILDVLAVGRFGSGTISVLDGGEITAGTLFASLSDLHGNGTITATAGAVLDADLVFDADHGTVQSLAFGSGGTLNLTADRGDLGVGYKQSGSVSISGGVSVSSGTGYLGYRSGSTGTATITGAGSEWNNSDRLYVGDQGNGTLTIAAGGQVSNTYGYLGYSVSGSTGAATVTDAGSKWTNNRWLSIGEAGSGILTIAAGGQVTSGNGYLGIHTDSTGVVTVTGLGSKWINSDSLHVGRSGTGTLTVSDGGEVTTGTLFATLSDLHGNGTITTAGAVLDADVVFDAAHGSARSIPFGSGGTLNVTLSGSQDSIQGDLGAGHKRSGSLTISEGVNVSSRAGYLGFEKGSVGTATVTDMGTQWVNSGDLRVGEWGSGMLTIAAGGQVRSALGYVGYRPRSTGMVTVTGAGSAWTNSGNLFVGQYGYGTLVIDDGAIVSANSGNLFIGEHGSGRITIKNAALLSVMRIRFDYFTPGDSFIDMASGGMLAMYGNYLSLSHFLQRVEGTDALRFWDDSLSDWAPLTSAINGTDYTLEYLTEGELAGYTLLTVGTAIPEPTAFTLILTSLACACVRRRTA